ncbi:probable E3 ubiquitin- ligase RHG1A isoform X1 [Olea europaea subsp. europaea]|uniref:RING-type E3 ubiquitin transferase n=1 Tax=Olea europaea subsp. europaea TaxID=158383 RepID=A0A8S0TPV2_OLEEU|nr:probable E3 ubiquitin- ligase RHG1A isoform X1 [Olea europaea subsp. europaea]
MFNACSSDALDISSGYRGNRPVTIDLNAPISELPQQMINLNETNNDNSGGLEIDREFGSEREPSHFKLFGRRVLVTPGGLSWDQHQQTDDMFTLGAENYIQEINSAQGTFPWSRNFFGSSSSYPNNNPINTEHLIFGNRINGGIAVQETSSLASHMDGSSRDIHVSRTENRLDNVPTSSNLFEVSAALYPASSYWTSWLTIDHVEAALRDLQCPALPIHSMEEYGDGFPNVDDESIRSRGNNHEIQFHDDVVHASEGMASTEMLETRVGVARSAEVFLEGGHTNSEGFEVYFPPFFLETQETFTAGENLIADGEDDAYAEIDLDATEHPSQEEEARDEVVRVNVDNSTFEEDHYEEEDYDMNEDMELDVDDMSYEELLALEEQIGSVSTGLREEEIFWRLKWYRHITFLSSSPKEEDLCCICLDEYIEGQDIGELDCCHKFHHDCIKKWLMQKNTCPMCKRTGLAN